LPSSKIKAAIADILKREGYIRDYLVEPTKPQATLRLALKYSRDRERALSGIRRVSKPGLRVYAKRDEVPRVLGGLGIAIISTSSGSDDRPRGPQGRASAARSSPTSGRDRAATTAAGEENA
jgi:small subunit ribosomal protein S8